MKLLHVSQGNIPSKWAHSILDMKMAEGFAMHVRDFRLITQQHWLSFLRPRFDYESYYGIRTRFEIVRLPSRRMWRKGTREKVRDPVFDAAALRYAIRNRADVIYTTSPNACRLCAQAGIPTLIEIHTQPNDKQFTHLSEVRNDRNLLGVITVTDGLEAMYLEAGIPGEKILVWPDAVNLDAFSGIPDKLTLRQSLGLPEKAFIATYCGHLYDGRGIEDILQCAAIAKDVRFVLVGGWEDDVNRRRSESAHLTNVTFTGFVPNQCVPSYLGASDVLLMPHSRTCNIGAVTSPMKLFEYMASRIPIVASDMPATRKHLVNDRSGLLVPTDSPDALADAITRIRNNPDKAVQLADAAFQDVQPLTWENRAKAVLGRFAPDFMAGARKAQLAAGLQ